MSYIKSYLDHTRRQNEDVKNIHAVLLASVLTGFFVVVYLFLVRGVTPPTPDINMSASGERVYTNNININNSNLEQNILENKNLDNVGKSNISKNNIPTDFNPFQSIKDIFEKASTDINNIKNNVEGSEYKSDTNTSN